jgi:hypothetical protein
VSRAAINVKGAPAETAEPGQLLGPLVVPDGDDFLKALEL